MANADFYGFSKEKVTAKNVVNATTKAEANAEVEQIKQEMKVLAARLEQLEDKYEALLLETRKLAIK